MLLYIIRFNLYFYLFILNYNKYNYYLFNYK